MHANENLELVRPTIEYGPTYLAMVDDFIRAGEEYDFNNIELARTDFAQFVRELEDEAEGIGLPPDIPPQQTYLLLKDGNMVVGEIRFRPRLRLPYEKFAGHIGYNIRPDQRGQGYATRQLALLLAEARKIQLTGVSLTTEDANPASVRVIEKNGGKLLRIIEHPIKTRIMVTDDNTLQVVDSVQVDQQCHFYWIDLTETSK
ncbi:MAG: GNAT family N-acetyltransferase [Ktedonobacteraceae bacterium]